MVLKDAATGPREGSEGIGEARTRPARRRDKAAKIDICESIVIIDVWNYLWTIGNDEKRRSEGVLALQLKRREEKEREKERWE